MPTYDVYITSDVTYLLRVVADDVTMAEEIALETFNHEDIINENNIGVEVSLAQDQT